MGPTPRLLTVLLLLTVSNAQTDPDTGGNPATVPEKVRLNSPPEPEVPAAPIAPETAIAPVLSETRVIVPQSDPKANVSTPQPVWAVETPVQPASLEEGLPAGKTSLVVSPDAAGTHTVLGAKCLSDADCAPLNDTYCVDGICTCKIGFIPSKHSMDRCLKVPSGIGDACEEEAQCHHAVPFSECMGSKCNCPPNFVLGDSSCWEKQMLGGVCNNTVQCEQVQSAMCLQGVCACESHLIPSPNEKCLQPAGEQYLAPCEEDIQCTHSYGDEARCSNSQCKCTNNYHFNSSKCVPDKRLGEACVNDEDCAVSDINSQEDTRMCFENSCSCATGFKNLEGEEICTRSNSGAEVAVSLTWVLCLILSKYYL